MKEYDEVYEMLGLPEGIRSLSLGKLGIPRGVVEQPARCYGFPPAMIPIWSEPDALIYTGYWKHWFSNRLTSFVRLYVNVACRVKEIACNAEQFFQYIVLQEITFAEGLTAEVAEFSKSLGVENADELDQLSIDSGDDPKGLLALSEFKALAPLICFDDQRLYENNFPHRGMKLNYESMSESCSLELNEQLEKDFIHSSDCPEWFKTTNKKKFFYQYLNEDRFKEAWFTLNSNGWSFEDAKKALIGLAEKSVDKEFHKLAESWLSLDHAKYKSGY